MATIPDIVHEVLSEYAVDGANFKSHLTRSMDGSTYTVLDIARDEHGQRFVATSVVIQLVDGFVIVEHDDNDKPVVDALVQAGIPREQIILAYAGENVLQSENAV
jgi:hypothetical protein